MKRRDFLKSAGGIVVAFSWSGPAVIHISFDPYANPPVIVSPGTLTINAGDKVKWTSSGDAYARVEIDFDSVYGKKGPFPRDGSPANPQRGRYKKKVGAPIVTTGAADRGRWKYTVIWIAADGTRHVLDPMLVVK